MLKKIKKQNKKIGEYPCVDYLHNALWFIKNNKLKHIIVISIFIIKLYKKSSSSI